MKDYMRAESLHPPKPRENQQAKKRRKINLIFNKQRSFSMILKKLYRL